MDFTSRYGPTAVVTGSGRGIGYGYANALARRGLDLLLTDVDAEALHAAAQRLRESTGRSVSVLVVDMKEPDAAEALARAAEGLDVGLLVCNHLMTIQQGRFLDADPTLYRDEIGVNVCAYVELANRFGRRLQARGRGGIILMSSMTGVVGSPYVTTYGASKAFVLALGSGLGYELRNSGVDVLTLVTGAVNTESYRMVEEEQSSTFPPMDVDEFAELALGALGSKRVATPGRKNAIISAILGRVLPRGVALSLMGGTLEKLMGEGGGATEAPWSRD